MVNNKNQSVIISGGTQGLGYAIAEALIGRGCKKLTITGRNEDKGMAAAKEDHGGCDPRVVEGNANHVEDLGGEPDPWEQRL